jgi:hypothetical protein
MPKQIMLDEMVLQEEISSQKKRFLEGCRDRINESIQIIAELNPNFDERLSQEINPFKIVIESSKVYDAEIIAGNWCYIYSIATNENAKGRIEVHTDRKEFVFDYKGQVFKVKYETIPKLSKRSR